MVHWTHMVSVEQCAVGGFDSNFSYIISDDATKEALVVDPSGDVSAVLKFIKTHALNMVGIVLTHSHPDHYDALGTVMEHCEGVSVYAHTTFPASVLPVVSLCRIGETVLCGTAELQVLHTPGHTPDGVCIYAPAVVSASGQPWVIVGDTLFVNGCGRIPRDQAAAMFASLQSLKQLPPETVVYPGHDYGPMPTDTIGSQCTTNRFLHAATEEAFVAERFR